MVYLDSSHRYNRKNNILGLNMNIQRLKEVIIEEFNPSLTKMYVLTMPEETTKKGPMFLFRKKDGGKIKSDGLVSITDIYGDY